MQDENHAFGRQLGELHSVPIPDFIDVLQTGAFAMEDLGEPVPVDVQARLMEAGRYPFPLSDNYEDC